MEKLLKFGHVRGGKTSTPCVITAASAFIAKSANFVYVDANGTITNCADGADHVFGWAEIEPDASTDAGMTANVIIDPSAVYRIPVVTGTYTPAKYLGRNCDLGVVATVMGADLNAHADDCFLIVGGDATLNYVDVMVNAHGLQEGTGVGV
jgi:hypothetical protein